MAISNCFATTHSLDFYPIKKNNKMNWLQGGPYYELSFLKYNSEDKAKLLQTILDQLSKIPNLKIECSTNEIEKGILDYSKGEEEGKLVFRYFEIKVKVECSGQRKIRLNISELSKELVKVNFWFYGSIYDADEWNQKGIRENDKPAFRQLFKQIQDNLKPILGTIAYEEDCEEMFVTEILAPNEYFSTKNLNLEKIKKRLEQNINEYEYFWIAKGEIGNKEDLEIELKNVTG